MDGSDRASVRLVCFDWGGVIIRICRTWQEAMARAADTHPHLASVDLSTSTTWDNAVRTLGSQFEIGNIEETSFYAQLSRASDGELTPDDVRAILDAVLIGEYPGMADVVGRVVRSKAVQTALLSNSNESHYRQHSCSSHAGGPRFPTISMLTHHVVSHQVGSAKPSEVIYRAIEAKTGCSGIEILFFDDLEKNIHAARSLGWRAEQIDHTTDPCAQIEQHLMSHGVVLKVP